MDIAAPGLIIEDFNMTFELRHRRLGKVALDPKASAVTQDPDSLPDYFRQMSRWSLGLLQTVRRHGLWPSGFCVVLTLSLAEAMLAHVLWLGLVVGLVLLALDRATGGIAHSLPRYASAKGVLVPLLTPRNLLLFVVLPDYLLTGLAAAYLRRPSLLVYGPGFVVVRIVDALAGLQSFWPLIHASSSGRWRSPTRRALGQDSDASS
jgi:hypothetical protein